MSKLMMTVAAALIALAAFANTAQAEPENPIVRGTIVVEVEGQGRVTGTGIDCGSDCSDNDSWSETEPVPTNRLIATAAAGWAFDRWSGCTPVGGQPNRCDAIYGDTEIGETQVTAHFRDVQAPQVALTAPAAGAVTRHSLGADVTVTDNDRVARVVYAIDGTEVASRTAAPWGATIDVSGWAEGEHSIVARAFDRAGNGATAAGRTFTVDKTAPTIELTDPAAATNAARPSFAFTTPSADLSLAECSITPAGQAPEWEPCAVGVWYSKDAPAEGAWKFEVRSTDHAGNRGELAHDFTVDRTAPRMEFTSGPADGATVEVGDVAYRWSTEDGLAVAQICAWDDGEQQACEGQAARALPKGSHSFRVTGTDAAGNVTTLNRTVNVRKDGTGPVDPDGPGPDGKDRTPPKVELVAPKQRLKGLARALRIKVRCDEACKGRVQVKGKGGIAFAGRVELAAAGTAKLALKPKAKVKRKLKRLRSQRSVRKLKLTATAKLRDAAGNLAASKLKLKVRR